MRLRRIEVKNFRKIGHETVEGLGDGLNVIVGDNEAGKSTLLAAMRAALFERHRVTGATADEMLPFGGAPRPEIWLDFELNGQSWRLHKAFCQKPEAALTGPDGQLTGDAVEERLAELFGFTPAGRGGSDPEKHHGTYSLLWVEQGMAHQSLRIGAGRESVASAIESEVGQVLGGERGRALLTSAEQRRGVFWGKNHKARGEWRSLQDSVEGLKGEIARLEQELATYDGKVDELESKQATLTRYRVESRLEKARKALETAVQTKANADQLAQVLREAGTHRQLAASERDAASARWDARHKLARGLESSRLALEAALAQADEAKGTLEARRKSVDKASETLAAFRAAHADADAYVLAVESALSRLRASEDLERLEAQRVDCEQAEQTRRDALTGAEAITLTSKDLDAIEDLQRKVDQARAQLQAASVRIEFEPEGQRRVDLDGQEHPGASSLRLARDAELTLEGFGRLRVHPGGGVEGLAQRSASAEQTLGDRLRSVGVRDLSHARSELERKAALQQEAAHQASIANAHAPQGLDALRQAIDSRRSVAEAPMPEGPDALSEATDLTLLQARQTRDAATAALRTAQEAWNAAEKARGEAERVVATHLERFAGKQRDHDGAAQELAQARVRNSDEDLASDLAMKDTRLREQRGREAQAQAELDAVDPEIVRLEWERARDAEAGIAKEIDTLERAVGALRIELTALGHDGMGEELALLQGQLALKQKQLAAQEQEAAASKLLHDVLTQAQRESKERWLGPVRKRVEPYLRILHPGADIVLHDETLELDGFIRNGKKEPFRSLSMGAREQVAVITRLALADILRTTNQPSVVILDDALVNTDEARLDRMHLVLRKAAENLQVLVMTCRERDFHNIGGRTIRLQ